MTKDGLARRMDFDAWFLAAGLELGLICFEGIAVFGYSLHLVRKMTQSDVLRYISRIYRKLVWPFRTALSNPVDSSLSSHFCSSEDATPLPY